MRTTRPTAVSACVPAGRSVCHCCFSSGGRVRTYERATNHCSQSSGTREAGALYRSQPVAGSADATPFRQEKPSRPAGRRPTGGGGTVLCSFWAEGRGRERPATPAEPRGRLLPPASSRWERAIPQLPQVLWESRLEAGFRPGWGELGVSPRFHPLKGGGKARSAEADRARGARSARTQAATNVAEHSGGGRLRRAGPVLDAKCQGRPPPLGPCRRHSAKVAQRFIAGIEAMRNRGRPVGTTEWGRGRRKHGSPSAVPTGLRRNT